MHNDGYRPPSVLSRAFRLRLRRIVLVLAFVGLVYLVAMIRMPRW